MATGKGKTLNGTIHVWMYACMLQACREGLGENVGGTGSECDESRGPNPPFCLV